jgi:large subunit ribosomal protein L32
MAGEPKRRHSRQRKGKRRASISFAIPNAIVCPNCGSMMIPHSICKNCGFYRGKEYVNHSAKTKTEETPAAENA